MLELEYYKIVIGIAISLFAGYLLSYFKEKGKNKALLGDIRRLTDEKEKITSEYKLDIEKRKYKYESKREQYLKYYNLIDGFGKSSNEEMLDTFHPILKQFFDGLIDADSDEDKMMKATSVFSMKIMDLLAKSNENLLRIRAETNSIRAIANDEILSLLDQIETLYDKSLEKSTDMLNGMTKNVLAENSTVLESQKEEIMSIGMEIKKLHKELLEEIRKDLNEI